jgi:hypothetical protein
MVDSLAKIIAGFPGEANRSRCLAHIVNLVVKIILRQFDVTKKKVKKNIPGDPVTDSNGDEDQRDMISSEENAVDEMERVLDKEEKEMDDGDEDDDEDGETLERDVEILEEALEEEVKEVLKLVKPVRQVLYKVGPFFFFFWLPYSFFFLFDPIPTFPLLSPSSFFFFFNTALLSFRSLRDPSTVAILFLYFYFGLVAIPFFKTLPLSYL